MSSASPFRSDSTAGHRQSTVPAVHRAILPAIRFAGFWAAILLPFVLTVLVVGGLVSQYPMLSGSVLVGNVVGLVLGRNYT